MRRTHRLFSLAAAVLINTAAIASAATFTLVSTDAPGVGFNDASPRAPVGGNAGTTLGEQRRNALQHAADMWGGATIQSGSDPRCRQLSSAEL